MANDEHLEILAEDGVHRWNSWREENPDVSPNFEGADLSDMFLKQAAFTKANLKGTTLVKADLRHAHLQGANLEGADLQNAQLQGATLDNANLRGANLVGANFDNSSLIKANFEDASLDGSRFVGANVSNATFRKAQFGSVNFKDAQFSKYTLGLGKLAQSKQEEMTLVEMEPMDLESDPNETLVESGHSNTLTVKYAKGVVGPANTALQSLTLPNELEPEDRDLVEELKRRVMELEQQLAHLGDEEDANEIVAKELPLWKKAFETLVLQTAANISSQGVAFSAGFIAGMLYQTCGPEGSSLWA